MTWTQFVPILFAMTSGFGTSFKTGSGAATIKSTVGSKSNPNRLRNVHLNLKK